MKMYLVMSRDNPDDKYEIMSMSPTDGLVLVSAERLGTEEPESEAEKSDFLAFLCEGPYIVQLFPKKEWAQAFADDVIEHGSHAYVQEVEVPLG